jgi:hypothetical protein
MFVDGLMIPALALAFLGWLVPRLLSLFWAEGVRPLMWLAFTATIIMLVLAAFFFVALYLWQGAPVGLMFEDGMLAAVWFFGRLGVISALLWGPILILSVAGLPKHWVKEKW